MQKIIFSLLFILLLAACAPTAATTVATEPVQPSSTPLRQATPSPIPDTDTPPPEVTSSPTLASTPTETLAPEEPTPDIRATLAAAVTPVVFESAPSPDGAWLAEFTRYDCTLLGDAEYAFERLEMVNQSTGARKELATQLQACGGLGAAGLGSLGWAENSQFFYYTDAWQGVPDGMPCYWERPMYAYNVSSDEVIQLKDGPASPDLSRVAMPMDGELLIWDRNLGEIARLEPAVADWAIGARSWSPDGKRMAYLQTEEECYPYGRSILVIADMDDLSQETFFQDDNMAFQGVEWREPRSIFLFAEDGKAWSLDPETGELSSGEN
jgi:hypothetical protein